MDVIIQTWNDLGQTWQTVIAVAATILLYFVTKRYSIRYIARLAAKTANDLDDRLIIFIRKFLWIIALFVGVVVVLKINHIEISPILAGAGIFGVAVGFAAKETIADVLSGIFLIADRPIKLGDRVRIESIGRHWGAWGDVVDIGLRRTIIRNTDGVIVNYPNSLLANSVIKNFSFEEEPLRLRVRFQVGYGADIEKAKTVAVEAIRSVDAVMKDTVQIVVRSIWDDSRGHVMSGVLLEGRYKVPDVRKRTVIRSEVLVKVLAALRENNIPLAAQAVQCVKEEGP